MRRLLPLLALLATCATTTATAAAEREPIRFTQTIQTDVGPLNIPLEMHLDDPTDTTLRIKVAGNLGHLQQVLPKMLTGVVMNECKTRIGVEMQDARSEDRSVRVTGRVQIIAYLCNEAEDLESRTKLISNITDVDVLLTASVHENCLNASIQELNLDPSGLVGAVLDLVGLTERLSEAVIEKVNSAVNDADSCLTLPDPLPALDAQVNHAGFYDFGDGTVGMILDSEIETTADNMIQLFYWMDEKGLFEK